MFPKKNVDEEILGSWLGRYYEKYNRAPRQEELTMKNGCPYGKEAILKRYGSIKNLCQSFGLVPRSEEKHHNHDKDLELLRGLIYKHRTTNRDVLIRSGCRDRSYYEQRFGSWSKAIEKCGVSNTERTLMRYFKEYNGEDPVQFLKKTIGENGEFSEMQQRMIARVKASSEGLTANKICRMFEYGRIKKEFLYPSVLIIASGLNPRMNYNTGIKYAAEDGHSCDSMQEKELDDWLFSQGYDHEVHVTYPSSKMKCDFLVGNLYVEYAGLMDSGHEKYRLKIQKKIDHCKRNNLRLHIVKNLSNEELNLLQAALTNNVEEQDI